MRAGVVDVELDEAVQGNLAGVDAMVVDQLEAVFDAGTAVGDLGEIVFAKRFLVGEAEGAMIGGDHLQMVVLQAVPEFGLVLLWRAGAA